MPKVSVIVPNYNHARYLPARMESVWDQTYRDFEIIYLDDASTDNSAEVLEELLIKRPHDAARTRLEVNSSNSGSPFKQWNKGAALARGEYFWIAEADDRADPRLLETLVDRLERNPQAGLAYCQSHIIDANDTIQGTALDFLNGGEKPPLDRPRWESDFSANGREECARVLACRNTIPNASAVLIRRSVFESVGGVDESFRLAGDWMLWIAMLLRSDLEFVAEPLNYYRLHQKSVSQHSRVSGVEAEENYRVIGSLLPTADVEPGLRERVLEALLAGWANRGLRGLTLQQHSRIYRAASATDRKLLLRIARRLSGSLRFRTRNLFQKPSSLSGGCP